MRNLYKILNLDYNADTNAIIQQMKKIRNQEVIMDIKTILLNHANRVQYNKLLLFLENISRIRNNLGINLSENWSSSISDEFIDNNKSNVLLYNQFLQKIKIIKREEEKKIPISKKNKFLFYLNLKVGVIIFIIIYVFIIIYSIGTQKYEFGDDHLSQKSKSENHKNDPITNSEKRNRVSDYKNLDLISKSPPKHKFIRTNIHSRRICPFEVKTEIGGYYLVKLENIYDKNNYFMIFIHGGKSVNVDVPLGSYLLKYASGDNWYGYEIFFGPEGSYNKSDNTLIFEIDDNQISGYTVTLYKVISGNMRTTRIDFSEF